MEPALETFELSICFVSLWKHGEKLVMDRRGSASVMALH